MTGGQLFHITEACSVRTLHKSISNSLCERFTEQISVLPAVPAHTHTHTSSAALILVSLGVIQIRWLLEDEIVSALRHSRVIGPATLQKVAEHVLRSSGRPHCHCEEVPLQFVFGPEQSLEKFKEARRTNRI